MSKFIFFDSDIITRVLIAIFILWLFSFYSIIFLLILFLILISILFRRKQVNLSDKQSIESNIVISPISGKYIGQQIRNEKIHLLFKIGILDGYGVYSPNKTEISKYYRSDQKFEIFNLLKLKRVKTQVSMLFKNKNKIKFKFKSIIPFNIAELYVRSGDIAISGTCLGYLPFGGKVVIELPRNSKVLVKKGDRVSSTQTLLASIEE